MDGGIIDAICTACLNAYNDSDGFRTNASVSTNIVHVIKQPYKSLNGFALMSLTWIVAGDYSRVIQR